MRKTILIIIAVILALNVNAEGINKVKENKVPEDTIKKTPDNWFNLDEKSDEVKGVSTEKAYKELLKDKKSKKIIVAIIDSGVDTEHEDLKNSIWTNSKEIAENGIDDDNNGYIDDIHGWNFIGGKDGTPVHYDTWEVTRLYAKYNKQFTEKKQEDLTKKEKAEYEKYQEIKKNYEKELNESRNIQNNIKNFYTMFESSERIFKDYLNKNDFTAEDLNSIESENDSIKKAKTVLIYCNKLNYGKKDIEEELKVFDERIKFKLNPEYNPRNIVGDSYNDKTERHYGNNKVIGPDAFHGTHVAGIIGADRNNNVGIKGVADNVEFMVLRTVPAGDERDKDVANSIYYAVDNGAQIINMSFGKSYSPYKEFVDKAFKYADKQGVLVIHAAGNDAENNDKVLNFPHRKYYNSKKECKTWIEVGASSWKSGDEMIGGFSNYGSENVDLFAPGVDIFSTTPNTEYKNASGTSMAAPVVSGVAALVWSYFPELTVKQLKEVLLKSVIEYKDTEVKYPGKKGQKIKFGELSKTGGIVNAYNAIKLAEKMTK